MAENKEKILIEFEAKGKGFNKVKENIDGVGDAQKRLSDTINLNKREYKLYDKILRQAGKSVNDLGIDTKTLNDAQNGCSKSIKIVRRAFKVYNKEIKKTNKTQEELNRGFFNITNRGRLLSNTFATLRSKLLLVTFGVALATKLFKGLSDAFIKQEKAEKKLEVALGRSSKALLNKAAALQQVSVFGDEAIIDVQALIGSFIKDEKAINAATKATLDLASAKGMDLKTAGDLVSKTLGSSTNALSRYGIEVTGAVGSTKRLESLTGNIATLFGGQAAAATETLGGSITQMANAMGDANEAMGKGFASFIKLQSWVEAFKDSAEAAREFFLEMSETPLETTIRQLEELGEDASGLRITLLQIKKLDVFKELGIEAHRVDLVEQNIVKTMKDIELQQNILVLSTKNQGKEYQALLDNGHKLEDLQRKINQEIEVHGGAILMNDVSHEKSLVKNFNIAVKNREHAEDELKLSGDRLVLLNSILSIINEINTIGGFIPEEKDVFGMTPSQWETLSANVNMWSDSVMNIANQYQALQQAQLNAGKQRELDAANQIKWEKKRTKAIEDINKKYEAKQDALNKKAKRTKRAQTVIATSTGIMEAYASKELGPIAKHVMAVFVGLQGALQLATIDAQKYRYGGVVGGQRHSQGGTMIEAERGEFVMRREAVEAVGIETMNRINQGGGAGSVNISFNGNVLSKDFIEDEAIPQIKEAIRRGADIGVE